MKYIMLKDVIKEAQKSYPGISKIAACLHYSNVQAKIYAYSSDVEKSNIAYAKYQLCKIIVDPFVPDCYWHKTLYNENN